MLPEQLSECPSLSNSMASKTTFALPVHHFRYFICFGRSQQGCSSHPICTLLELEHRKCYVAFFRNFVSVGFVSMTTSDPKFIFIIGLCIDVQSDDGLIIAGARQS